MSIHFGDLPTWLASIGTVGALAAALYQIGSERRRRIAQEAHDRLERHQAQARLVSAWIGKMADVSQEDIYGARTAIELINGSCEPIYGLVAGIVFIQGAAPLSLEAMFEVKKRAVQEHQQFNPPIAVLSILPGRWRIWVQSVSSVMQGRMGAELAFTDRAGAHWVRRAKGGLEDLPSEPFLYLQEFGMDGPPYDFRMPDPGD
jgi:hypothetical protein